MNISPINGYNTKISYRQVVPQTRSISKPSFGAHADFDMLGKKYEIKASSYFRRGGVYGYPADEFLDVVDVLQQVFRNTHDEKKKILIVGIGDSQEPFSYLAMLKQIENKKQLKDFIDMYTVDLQSIPSDQKLRIDSFYDCGYPGMYATGSFIKDDNFYGQNKRNKYRVKDDVYEFLRDTYNDPKKSKWETPIQDAVKTYDDEFFDVISINNVLPYVKMVIGYNECLDVVRQIYRCLKPNGYLITDPYNGSYTGGSGVANKMVKINDGIYKK